LDIGPLSFVVVVAGTGGVEPIRVYSADETCMTLYRYNGGHHLENKLVCMFLVPWFSREELVLKARTFCNASL
jgi:hypothetical protein